MHLTPRSAALARRVPAASIATPIAAGLIAACLLLAVLILPAPSRADESPLRLFASVEEAWLASDTERLASLVDTTSVRIALKPGVPPASAVTRNAAAFLFQDQLRLVKTREFRVIKLEVSKKGKARAVARWEGDWGGRQGLRTVEIVMTAIPAVGRWLLTEVRADD